MISKVSATTEKQLYIVKPKTWYDTIPIYSIVESKDTSPIEDFDKIGIPYSKSVFIELEEDNFALDRDGMSFLITQEADFSDKGNWIRLSPKRTLVEALVTDTKGNSTLISFFDLEDIKKAAEMFK